MKNENTASATNLPDPAFWLLEKWETLWVDEEPELRDLLVEAFRAGYQAGYQDCEAKYEAAMSDIVFPTDLELDNND